MIDLAEIVWGRSPTRRWPPVLGKEPIYLGQVSILPQQLIIIAAGLHHLPRARTCSIGITLTGKAFPARLPTAARVSGLMGINTPACPGGVLCGPPAASPASPAS